MDEHDGPPGVAPVPREPAAEPQVPAYPAGLAGDVDTAKGARLHVRPIRTTDGPGLAEFHRGLSDRSVYRRFFFVHPALTDVEVEHFTHVDYADRLALVAEDDGRIVAVGRYERTPGTAEAEVAFVVTDSHQQLGIGSVLLAQLARAALGRGITTFTAETLAENRAMLAVFRNSGYALTTSTEFDTVSVRFPIDALSGPAPPPG